MAGEGNTCTQSTEIWEAGCGNLRREEWVGKMGKKREGESADLGVQDLLLGIAKGDLRELQDGRGQLGHVRERDLDDRVAGDLLSEAAAHHLLQGLLLRLRLAGQLCGTMTKACDVFLPHPTKIDK